jgi:hypothetical protein
MGAFDEYATPDNKESEKTESKGAFAEYGAPEPSFISRAVSKAKSLFTSKPKTMTVQPDESIPDKEPPRKGSDLRELYDQDPVMQGKGTPKQMTVQPDQPAGPLSRSAKILAAGEEFDRQLQEQEKKKDTLFSGKGSFTEKLFHPEIHRLPETPEREKRKDELLKQGHNEQEASSIITNEVVSDVKNNVKRIDDLHKQIQSIGPVVKREADILTGYRNNLATVQDKLTKLKDQIKNEKDRAKVNQLIPQFNALIAEHNTLVKKHNIQREKYNTLAESHDKKVGEINDLIAKVKSVPEFNAPYYVPDKDPDDMVGLLDTVASVATRWTTGPTLGGLALAGSIIKEIPDFLAGKKTESMSGKEIGEEFENAAKKHTWEPQTEMGRELTNAAMTPFEGWEQMGNLAMFNPVDHTLTDFGKKHPEAAATIATAATIIPYAVLMGRGIKSISLSAARDILKNIPPSELTMRLSTITEGKGPHDVFISPQEFRDFQTGLTSDLPDYVKDALIDSREKGGRKFSTEANKKGVTISISKGIPKEELLEDKPWLAKTKEAVGLEPRRKILKTEIKEPEKPTEAVKEAKPDTIVDDFEPETKEELAKKEGEKDESIKEGQKPEGDQSKYPRDGSGGTSSEAGGGGSLQEGRKRKEVRPATEIIDDLDKVAPEEAVSQGKEVKAEEKPEEKPIIPPEEKKAAEAKPEASAEANKATPDPLVEEAKKYKTAEEFVKANTYYRGQDYQGELGNFFTTNKKDAQQYATKVHEIQVAPEDIYKPDVIPKATSSQIDNAIGEAERKGFKAMWVDESKVTGSPQGELSLFVFDKKGIKTKKQLASEWNQTQEMKGDYNGKENKGFGKTGKETNTGNKNIKESIGTPPEKSSMAPNKSLLENKAQEEAKPIAPIKKAKSDVYKVSPEEKKAAEAKPEAKPVAKEPIWDEEEWRKQDRRRTQIAIDMLGKEDQRTATEDRRKPEPAANVEGKQPWEMTQLETAKKINPDATGLGAPGIAQHKVEIKAAIARGETIPPEVLKDYPELQKAPESNLIEESRKYKTAEEFVKAQLAKQAESANMESMTPKKGTANIPAKTTPQAEAGNWKDRVEADTKDGWFVTGRNGTADLLSEFNKHEIFVSYEADVAEQYAGHKGSVWQVKPKEDAKILDATDSNQIDDVVDRLKEQFDNGELSNYTPLEKLVSDEIDTYGEDVAWKRIQESLEPKDIVEDEGFYSDTDFVNWLYENFEYDFVKTNRGGIAYNPDAVEIRKVDTADVIMDMATGKNFVRLPVDTGIKKAVKTAEREARGLEEVESEVKRVVPAFEEGKRLVDSEERDPRILAESIASGDRKGVLEDKEVAMLLYDAMRITKQVSDISDSLEEAILDGDKVKECELRLQHAKLLEDLNTNDIAVKRGGTEWSAVGRMYQQIIKEDYSLAKTLQRARIEYGDKLPREIEDKITELTRQLEDAQKKLKEYDEKAAVEAAKKEIQRIKSEPVIRQYIYKAKERQAETKDEILAERERIISAFNKTLSQLHFMFDPTAVKYLAEWTRNLVKDGLNTVEDITDEIYRVTEANHPELGITKRDIRDAISGYGRTFELSREEIDVQLREIKRQARLISAYEDAVSKQVPLRSGMQRDPLSDKVREMGRQVRQAMREAGIDSLSTRTPEEQWKTSLDAVKTRLKNQIADLTKQLETGKKTPKKIGIEYDEEANALKEERDSLSAALAEIEGKPQMSPEQKIKMAMAAVEKSIAEYDRRIKENDLTPQKKVSTTPVTPELKAMREKRDQLKEIYKGMQDEAKPKLTPEQVYTNHLEKRKTDLEEKLRTKNFAKKPRRTYNLDERGLRLKGDIEGLKRQINIQIKRIELENRPKFEKDLDLIVRARRAVIFTSSTIFLKLSAAATARFVLEPIRNIIIGGTLYHVPGLKTLMRESPTEGGGYMTNIRAERARLARLINKNTWIDSWDMLTKGYNTLSVLDKGEQAQVRDWLDIPAHAHGAIKEPVKQGGYFAARVKYTQYCLENNLDPTNPVIEQMINAASMFYAKRQIFMNDNIVNDLYKSGLRMVERKGIGGKVATTFVRVELPVTKVPSNIFLEVGDMAVGLPKGLSQTLYHMLKSGAWEKLNPDQKDNIARSLKNGLLGLAIFGIAFYLFKNGDKPVRAGGFYRQGAKRKITDPQPDELRIGDVNIPKPLLHNTALITFQAAWTLFTVQEQYEKEMKAGGTWAGTAAAVMGLGQTLPFLDEPARMAKAMKNQDTAAKMAAEQLRGLVLPPDVPRIAKMIDTDVAGQPVARKPETAGDVFKMAIPGLRQQVPENTKKEKTDLKAKLIDDLRNDEPDAKENLDEAKSEGQITKTEKKEIKKEAKEDTFIASMKHLSLQEMAKRIEKNATPEQKEALYPVFKKKFFKERKDLDDDTKQKYLDLLDDMR